MLLVERIIGDRSDASLSHQLHHLEHAHAVDFLVLPRNELSRRRFRARSEDGLDVAITLPREEKLFDGAILALDTDSALVVKVEADNWLRLRPADMAAALQVGFHAGNLHWRVRFDGDDLLVAVEQELKSYLERLEDLTKNGTVMPIESGEDG